MKILEKTSDGLKRRYAIFISNERIENAVDEKIKEAAQRVSISGFRPGKVPIDVIRRVHGDNIKAQAVEGIISETIKKIFSDEKLVASTSFSTSITKEDKNGIEFLLNFEELPSVKLKDFSGIELTKHIPEITEKETNEVLNGIRKEVKNWVDEQSGAAVKEGHKVVVELVEKNRANNLKNKHSKDVEIVIGSKNLIEGIWKPLIGGIVSEVKEFVVNYPKNMMDKSFSGKSVSYSAKINKILKAVEYELDDDFAKKLGYKNFAELKNWAQLKATEYYNQVAKGILKRNLLEKLSGMYDFDVPSDILEIELSSVKRQIFEEAKKLGKEITSKIDDECKKIAIQRVRLGLIVSEISKKEKITVTNDEVAKSIKEIALQYPGNERVIYEMHSNRESRGNIIGQILENKVTDFLLNAVKIKEKKTSAKEIIAIDEEIFDFFK